MASEPFIPPGEGSREWLTGKRTGGVFWAGPVQTPLRETGIKKKAPRHRGGPYMEKGIMPGQTGTKTRLVPVGLGVIDKVKQHCYA